MSTGNTIRALDGFSNVSDGDVVARGTAVQSKLTGNPYFPNPPVDLTVFKTNIDTFSALIAEALDGGKKAAAEKNKQRETVIHMLRQLGRYIEVASKNDLAIFETSGFEAASTTRTVRDPLSENFRKIQHGATSGQIVAWLRSIQGAVSYEFRFGPETNGAPPATWTMLTVVGVKTPVTLNDLTPGITYAFQARVLTKEGYYTTWSDPVTFMCT